MATGPDRVADIVFVLFLLSQALQAQYVWSVGYSPTRAVFFTYVLLGMALVGRYWARVPTRVTVATGVLALIMMAGQISWTWQWDTHQANNYWQDWRLMLAALVFGGAFGARRWGLWRRIIVGFGLAAALLQAVVLLSGPVAGVGDGGGPAEFYRYRPVSAQIALLMIAALVLLLVDRTPSRSHLAAAALLGMSVVLSQHRSAWVALAAVMALLAIQGTRSGWSLVHLSPLLITTGFWVVALLLPAVTGRSVLPGTSGTDAQEGTALPSTVTSSGNWEWRLDMWRSRLQAPRSLLEVFTGGALGPTPSLGPDAVTMNPHTSAHNLLLDQFIMIGLIGIACAAVCVGTALFAGRRPPTGLPVLLVGALAFGVFYNWPVWLWLLVGASCAMAREATDASVPAPTHEVEMVA